MASQNIDIVINAKDQATKALSGVQSSLTGVQKTAEDTGKQFGISMGAIRTALATIGAYKAAQGIVTLTNNLEQNTVAFTTMLGSAEAAKVLLEDLSNFAATTPFELTGIRQTAKQLLAFGFESQELIPTLKSLGDVASGLSVPIEQIAYAYGQVRTANQLYGTELRQFMNAGVPLLAELAKMFGVNEAAMKKMVENGEIGFKDVEKAFQNMSGEGGAFFDLMSKQSETLGGEWSNLQDQVALLGEQIGTSLLPSMKNAVTIMQNSLELSVTYKTEIKNLLLAVASLAGAKGMLSLITAVRTYTISITTATGATTVFTGAAGVLRNGLLLLRAATAAALGPLGLIATSLYAASKAWSIYHDAKNNIRQAEENVLKVQKQVDDMQTKQVATVKKLQAENAKLSTQNTEESKIRLQQNKTALKVIENEMRAFSKIQQANAEGVSEAQRKVLLEEHNAFKIQANNYKENAKDILIKNGLLKETADIIEEIPDDVDIDLGGAGGGLKTQVDEAKESVEEIKEETYKFDEALKNVSKTAIKLASALYEKSGLGIGLVKMQETLDNVKDSFKDAFGNNNSLISETENQISSLKSEVSSLEDKIKSLRGQRSDLSDDRAQSLAERALEIEEELADKELSNAEKKALEKELALASEKAGLDAINEAREWAAMSETERIIETARIKRESINEEIENARNLLTEKENALSQEEVKLQELNDAKIQFEANYQALFMENAEERQMTIEKAIESMKQLNNLQYGDSESQSGARAQGGNVNAGQSYMVGENGRELFVPKTSGTIVSNDSLGGSGGVTINMGGVTVQNAADENRLIEKMKTMLKQESKAFNLGIA